MKINLQSLNNTHIRKKIYKDFTSHLLINIRRINAETTYGLTTFGAMLAIALIRYFKTSMNKTLLINSFTWNDKKKEEYYEKLAHNYKEKLPLLFERWSLLRLELDSLLYNGFDFLIFEKDRTNIRDTSVWFGGNKEFYEEVQSMAKSTHVYEKLLVIHAIGKDMIEKYRQYGYKIFPLRKKIAEIDGELFIMRMLSSLEKGTPGASQHLEVSKDSITKIEEIFIDEVSFFFYLNLNKNEIVDDSISSKHGLSINHLDWQDPEYNKILYTMNEMKRLGSPRQRLMAVLSKDNTIREWFCKQMTNILSHRAQVSEKMSEFSKQITKPQQHKRTQETRTKESKKDPSILEFIYEEYDISKICSYEELPYEY